jgi:predicted transcriptional regulator
MEKELLLKSIKDGLSQRQISSLYSISQSTVKYWLKKYGLKTKLNQYNTNIDNVEFKKCPVCNQTKTIDSYYKRSSRKDNAGYCKECSNNYHSNRIKNIKIRMIEYKGNECVDCGLNIVDSHYSVFDFHHLNSNEKDVNFKRIKYQSWNKIVAELDKCVLLCANCHRLRHAK